MLIICSRMQPKITPFTTTDLLQAAGAPIPAKCMTVFHAPQVNEQAAKG